MDDSEQKERALLLDYTNYRGVRGIRRVLPSDNALRISLVEQHGNAPDYVLHAFDLDRGGMRAFQARSIHRMWMEGTEPPTQEPSRVDVSYSNGVATSESAEYINPKVSPPPRGVSLNILTLGGVQVDGHWRDDCGFVAWAPKIKIPKWARERLQQLSNPSTKRIDSMGHYDSSRPGYCSCGAAPGNIKNGVCQFCGPRKKAAEPKGTAVSQGTKSVQKPPESRREVLRRLQKEVLACPDHTKAATHVGLSLDNDALSETSLPLDDFLCGMAVKLDTVWVPKATALLKELGIACPPREHLVKMIHFVQDAGHNNISSDVLLSVPKEWTIDQKEVNEREVAALRRRVDKLNCELTDTLMELDRLTESSAKPKKSAPAAKPKSKSRAKK